MPADNRERILMDGAIFDVDGTIIDSMETWHGCGVRYLRSIGIEAEPGLSDFLFTQTNETGAIYMVEHYGLDREPSEVADGMNREMERYYLNDAELKDGALELLNRLRDAGIPMTVATSTERFCIEGAFRKLDLTDYFMKIFTCTEVGATKSDPRIFFEAAKLMGSRPENTWVFEDGLYAIETAVKAGFKTVAVYDSISAGDWDKMKELAAAYVTRLDDFVEV